MYLNMAVVGRRLTFLTFFIVLVNHLKADIFEHEHMLQTGLMKSYLSTVRPVTVLKDPVRVQLMFDLLRVDELDAARETMTTSFQFLQTWKDPRLAWNTSLYGDIHSIRLQDTSIWLPDVEVVNAAPGVAWSSKALPVINYDGTVFYVPHKTLTTYCSMDLTLFPFDTQTCSIEFVPWTHNILELELGIFGQYFNKTAKTTISVENKKEFQWELLDGTAEIFAKKYECCPEKYQHFVVTLQMRRVTNFYRYVVTWPTVVACFLVPFLFAIPSHSPQKITYGLGLMVFELMIILIFVETSTFDHTTVPNIAVFHVVTLILSATCLLLSVFIVSASDGSGREKPVPAWLQRFTLNDSPLRRLFCLGRYRSPFPRVSKREGLLDDPEIHGSQHGPELHAVTENEAVRDISYSLREITEKMTSADDEIKVKQDWREVGRLMDRILGFLSVITVFILLIWSMRIWSR